MSEGQQRAIELVDAAKRRAVHAIEKVWEAYHDPKDGLKLREQQAAIAGARVSSYIFRLAQFAQDNSPRRTHRPHELFAAMCSYAEARLKENHNVENLKEALPCWATYKTNILSGMKGGLDPNDYQTEWEFRKAAIEARFSLIETKEAVAQREFAKRPADEDAELEGRGNEVTKLPTKLRIEPTRKFFRATSIASSLKLLLAQLVVEADYIKKGYEDEAEAILREAREKLAALVDKRKIKDPATKLAIEADVVGDTRGKREVA
jgi:hypothetical protein